MHNETLTEMRALLAQEKALLRDANVAAVAELETRKLELAMRLEQAPDIDRDTMRELGASLRRNQELLDAIRKGTEAAKIRLVEIRKAMNHLDTYTRNGDLTNLQVSVPKIERRA